LQFCCQEIIILFFNKNFLHIRENQMASIRITLSEYIQDVGIESVAKDLGTSVSTVKAWRYYNRVPRIKQAKQLMQHSRGVLNWDSIYGPPEEVDSDRADRKIKISNADVA
jgi:hypothetical protein